MRPADVYGVAGVVGNGVLRPWGFVPCGGALPDLDAGRGSVNDQTTE